MAVLHLMFSFVAVHINKHKQFGGFFSLAHLEIAPCSFSLVVAMGMSQTNVLNGYSPFSLTPSV